MKRLPRRLPSYVLALIFQNTMGQLLEADIAAIQRVFPLVYVQGNSRFIMRNPLPDERRRNAKARSAMEIDIIAHRPQVNLRPMPDDTEMLRSNLLYLVRMAPLTRQLRSGAWVLTPAGNFFPGLKKMVKERRIDASIYQGQHVAKYGCTSMTVRRRLTRLMSELRGKHFPVQSYPPYYALCISGLLADSLFRKRMEACLRNMFDRRSLRFRQHAQGELYPMNLSSSSETLEFVLSDERCNNIFFLMQRLAGRLGAARRWVQGLVIQLDNLRQEQLAATDIDEIVPRANVHELYFRVLEYAAASIDA